jgi:hypothetical protein
VLGFLVISFMNHLGMCMVKRKSFVCFVVFILILSWFVHVCFADKAEKALVDAENDLVSVYVAIGEAEKVGANVSELLVKLRFAGTLLAQAYNANRTGDYGKAYSFAIDCSESVDGIVDEALGLKLEAEKAYSGRLFMTTAVSSVALCVLFVSSLFGWRSLKKKYVERILGMKPKVEKAE